MLIMLKFRSNVSGKPPGPREDLGASLVHGGSITLLDCLFRLGSGLCSPLQGFRNLTLHNSQVSVHQGSSHASGAFPESSSRTRRVFGRVGQVFMHQGASLGHLRSLPARAEQGLNLVFRLCFPLVDNADVRALSKALSREMSCALALKTQALSLQLFPFGDGRIVLW